jgi:hypothetical protein
MKARAMKLAVMAMVLGIASAGYAQNGIDRVVKLLETRYAVHHHGIPGLWLAKPFMFGSGVSGLRIAQFDNFRIPAGDGYALNEEVRKALGDDWTPFVETWSKADHEWSVIYAREKNGRLQLLIVNSDEDDGLEVLQMDVSGKARDEWISEPVSSAEHNGARTGESAKE